jgi:hydroxyacylglutathione hydrolase
LLLDRFHDDTVAQTSYLIGCESAGLAIVIDPNRDADRYLQAAARRHLRIAYIAETHIHADFVSGARDLARRSGAQLLLSGEGGVDWQYAFAAADGARILHHDDRVDVGGIRLTVRHTPGHTPEHLAFIVTDTATSDRPVGMCSGDFIFVGDVGRPDLLERVANASGSMETLARQLFASIQAMRDLPDHLQIWPGHGAGSACGKSLGAMPSTTLGYERLANWAFQIDDESAFVKAALAGQPEAPSYFAVMKTVNREGPTPARVAQHLPELDLASLQRAMASNAVLVDVRPAEQFAAEHVPGTLNIPFGGSFAKWAGTLLPYDRQLALLAHDAGHMSRAKHALSIIGLDRVIGWAADAVREQWKTDVGPLQTTPQLDVSAVARRLSAGDLDVIDVRAESEWNEGHLAQADHRYLGNLLELSRDVPRDTPIAVHCQGGSRSAIAASLLQAHGFTNVSNVTGGYRAWQTAGFPVTHPADSSESDE